MMDISLVANLKYFQLIPPVLVGVFLLYFCWRYYSLYYRMAKKVSDELTYLSDKIEPLASSGPERVLAQLDEVFAKASKQVLHAWREYRETLHVQLEERDGEQVVRQVRATAQAGSLFGDQNLVDTPLQTEYFKHLPGILTGIGIIGTFAGLLIGLYFFDATDPAKIQESVSILLSGVRDAFLASAFSIMAAMIITNSEKKHLRSCYAALEKLNANIDRLFDSGVGEEYLAKLVKSSEESANQARQLKDGLVGDLREMLQNLVDSQVRENAKLAETLGTVYRESGNDIAASISGSIEQSFRDPLTRIADSVQAASGDQSGMVQGMLQDVLTAFMAKLDTSFGQQFTGLQDMMGQSVAAMLKMQGAFQSLVEDMRTAGESSSQAINEQLQQALADMSAGQSVLQAGMNEMIANLQQAVAGIGSTGEEAGARMAQQLERLFADSEARQQRMAEGMQNFIDGLKESVGRGQQETMTEIGRTVGLLGEQLGQVMQTLETSRQGMNEGALAAQQRVQDGARELVAGLGENVQSLLAGVQAQQQETQSTVIRIGDIAGRSIEGMKEGAERMRSAADRFGAAGESALKLMDSTGNAAQQFNLSSGAVSTAIRELSNQVGQYQNHREAVQKMLGALEGALASTQNEASSRAQMTAELNQVVARMKDVNREAALFLERVEGTLGTSFNAFGEGVERSLSLTLGSLDQEMSKAVGSLATGVQEMGDSFEELSETLVKLRRVN